MKKSIILLFVLAVVVMMAFGPGPVQAAKTNIWRVPGNFPTIQAAIDDPAVSAGDTILVGPGSFAGALLTKGVEIRGAGGAVINDGPAHSSGLIQGFRMLAESEDAVISHLRFEVDLAIMNGEAANHVTVDHCTFIDCVQAISNWRGSFWQITHNEIVDLRTRCGGGIGILVADFMGGIVESNYVAHNKISGTLHVADGDCGGYDGSGIVLYADFRWGRQGADEIKDNTIIKNKISLTSDNPSLVDVWAFEMTDSRNDTALIVIFDNAIGFNDFRGTVNQIQLSPDNLDEFNAISRNLGDSRGHGLHPRIFFR